MSKNEKLFVIGSKSKQIEIYSVGEKKLLKRIEAHSRGVWDAEFNSVSTQIATGSSDKSIKIWGLQKQNFELLQTLGAEAPILRIKWATQDLQLVTAHSSGMIAIWNLVKGIMIFSTVAFESRLWSLELLRLPQETLIIAGDNDSNILVFRDTSKEQQILVTKENNEKKVSRNQLEILLEKKLFEEALDYALKVQMNSGFIRSLESWISHTQD